MVEKGLVQVDNPSQAFIVEHEENIGSAIVPVMEGNRLAGGNSVFGDYFIFRHASKGS